MKRLLQSFSIALIAITGPYSIILVPLSWLTAYIRKSDWSAKLAAVTTVGAMIQLFTLGNYLAPCAHRPDIYDPLLLNLIGSQIYLFGLLSTFDVVSGSSAQSVYATQLVTVAAIVGSGIVFYAVRRGGLELRLFLIFSLLIFLACIRRLQCDPNWKWPFLFDVNYAIRYWYVERLAVIGCLVTILSSRIRVLQGVATAAIALIVLGSAKHWAYSDMPDVGFYQAAERFEQANPGTTVILPSDPPGWSLILKKR